MSFKLFYKSCAVLLIALITGSGSLNLIAQDLLGGADGGRDIEGGGSVAVLATFSQTRKKARRIEARPTQVRRPIVALALEKENAIADLRKLMGATNPANAEEGTIRKKWASSIEYNAIHGSDAEDTARFELSFFFAGYELAE